MLSFLKVQFLHPSCSIYHPYASVGILLLLLVLCSVRIYLPLLPLFAQQLCNYKLVVTCLLRIAQYLACFQVVNFMQQSSGFYNIPEATVILL